LKAPKYREVTQRFPLELPKRAIAALTVHQARQPNERRAVGGAWHNNNLVFCHENGDPCASDQLNWRFPR
jgi:hypothetical protein